MTHFLELGKVWHAATSFKLKSGLGFVLATQKTKKISEFWQHFLIS
jgi:hypothetical protein